MVEMTQVADFIDTVNVPFQYDYNCREVLTRSFFYWNTAEFSFKSLRSE